ncbi:unnamed protein product [Mytilus edulis]|uniref:HTH CENPB-type domain-containing protein n=1 Tax=Mytilus edulis TaxID=6550 RepID=A0A8S3RUR5_MYTED|nr:unnamed protein product [Mytilus edulis]
MDLDSPATKPTVLAIKDEEALVGHILRMEERGFGLTITDVRKLAYEIAVRSGRKHCFNNDKKSAGYDWWQGFRDRHPCLSVRIPEGLSAARSSMLNPNVISAYFQKLGSFMDKLNIKDKPQQIFNADETGVSTVHDPSKVVGKRGKKSVHSKTSGERGENVTALCCVNAEARVLPPMLIFKGQRVSQALMGNAPANTLFACKEFLNELKAKEEEEKQRSGGKDQKKSEREERKDRKNLSQTLQKSSKAKKNTEEAFT